MEIKNKRKIVRSTNAQINVLVDYMAANPLFAAGEFSGPLGSQKLEEDWAALAMVLSNHGPQKTVEQWKHTWRDLKRKAREEGSKVRQALQSTGNIKNVSLSQQGDRILNTIGHECATGINSAGETGVGSMMFNNPTPMPEIEIEIGSSGQILVQQPTPYPSIWQPTPSPSTCQPTPGPSTCQHTPIPSTLQPTSRSRRMKLSKAEKFISTQEKTNELLKELKQEMAKSNNFRAAQLKVLQEIADTLKRSA